MNPLEKEVDSYVKLAKQMMTFLETGTLRILLVEDNPMDVEMFKSKLEKATLHYDVDTVDNSTDAFFKIKTGVYHLIVLDWHLGHEEHTGLDIVKILHEQGFEFAFVIFTSRAEDYLEAARHNCLGCIDKLSCTTESLDADLIHAIKNGVLISGSPTIHNESSVLALTH